MKRHIQALREKPIHIRKRIAAMVSIGITALIFLFWIASMSIGNKASPTAVVDPLSPAQNLKASVIDAFSLVKTNLFGSSEPEGGAEIQFE
jgi:hypothetical protein